MSEMRLHDPAGNRLYLNAGECPAFLAVARPQPAHDRTLCETLHWTGCRPSELLEITPTRVDLSGGTITIRSLKKRKDASGVSRVVYRSVPVPPDCLDTLNTAHGIREAQKSRRKASAPLWPLSRVPSDRSPWVSFDGRHLSNKDDLPHIGSVQCGYAC